MKRYVLWILIIFTVVVRSIIFHAGQTKYPNGTRIKIADKVLSEPIRYEFSQRIILQRFKFYLPHYPEIFYGDKIIVEGVVEDGELKNPELVKIEEGDSKLFGLRKRLVGFYKKSLPEPHSSLIAGMTLGSKANIPKIFWDKLKTSGTVHVVVASGMNVTLVAGFLVNILILFVPRRKAIVGALVGIWLYALMAGFDAPIIRAAIMGSIGFTAQGLGRINYAWRGLFLCALGMLIVKPEWLMDLGFILSFVATASLMLFERRCRKIFAKVPSIFREGLSTSFAAQIGVAPILFATFGQFNILSPIINALVLWTVSPITVVGMLAAIVSLVSVYLGRLVLLLTFPLTFWFVWIVQLF